MIENRNKKIGVFDSGFGGLDILKDIVKKLPQYDYIYLADTARAPYGSRSQEKILEFTTQAVDFLFENGCELIILACNTASSDALHKIQKYYLPKKYPKRRVLGVLVPAVEDAKTKTQNKKIGVIATEATVKSRAFVDEFKKVDTKIKVFQKACPLLVPIVESGEVENPVTDIILKYYLTTLMNKNIDTLVLGCTHYGLLDKKIRKIVGDKVHVVSEAKVVPEKLKDYLERHPEIEVNISKNSTVSFCSTDTTDNFQKFGSKFFGKDIVTQKVEL